MTKKKSAQKQAFDDFLAGNKPPVSRVKPRKKTAKAKPPKKKPPKKKKPKAPTNGPASIPGSKTKAKRKAQKAKHKAAAAKAKGK